MSICLFIDEFDLCHRNLGAGAAHKLTLPDVARIKVYFHKRILQCNYQNQRV